MRRRELKIQKLVYNFFIVFFISFSMILLLGFFVNSINYCNIILRALVISFLYFIVYYTNKILGKLIPIKLFMFSLFLVLVTYIFSSYEKFKLLDKILGIDKFSEKIVRGEFFAKYFLSNPIRYEKYITAQESFEEKIKEFNNSIEYLELKIHENVNKLRLMYNLSIIIFNNKLKEIAKYHSKDMAENEYFDHISIRGETLSDRFKLFNYECKIIVGNKIYSGAENLFFGYIYKSYSYDKLTGKIISYNFYSLDEFAEEVVISWYNSDSHRENLLFPYWRNEGIGVFVTKDGKIYVTQVFC